MKRSLHWLQRQTRLSSLLLLLLPLPFVAAGTEDEDCGVVLAVDAAGTGVLLLELDERALLSCAADMAIRGSKAKTNDERQGKRGEGKATFLGI